VDVIPHERNRTPVSVVVPALDEEQTLGAVLDAVAPFADELIVIDGRSKDRTAEVGRRHRARVVVDSGRGKGAAVRLGLAIAAHPVVVFIDADGSHEPADIPALVAPIWAGRADIVIGSRMTGGSDELFSDAGEFVRLTGSMIINLAINYRWNVRLSDTQNGFRAVARDRVAALGLSENGTTIEQEMVMKALAAGLHILNVPSHEYVRQGGKSKIDVRRVWLRYVLNVVRHVLRPDRKDLRQPGVVAQLARDRATAAHLPLGAPGPTALAGCVDEDRAGINGA
jgi:dolichol-phosphate hexosyltransferase